MLFTLSQTIICLLQIHGLQDQIFLNYSNSPLRSSSQILPPKSLLFSFLIHEIKQFLCTSHLIAPFSTIILGKTLIASRGLIFTLEFCTSKLIHSSVLAYSSKMSSGDSPLKRQKITVKVKQIEKGQSSPPSKPPTTPSQDVHDKKQQLPPPLATETEWIPGNTLSQHPAEIRQALFMKKNPSVYVEKKVNMDDFEDFNVMDPLYKMGWGGILELESDICYDQPIIDWMSTLQRHGEGEALTLTGTVRGREYTLTHHKIRRMFSVDTGIRGEPGRAYEYPDETYLEPSNLETQDWIDGLRELFFLPPEIQQVRYTTLGIADLKPQAKVLWKLGVWNIFPREGYQNKVRVRDISILYGLISGKVAISYAHLVMLNLLAMYESACKSTIPHGYLLSRFLDNEGGISTDMEPRWINVEYRTFTQQYIPNLEFSLEPPFHIVDWEKRTFVADFGPAEREIVEREKGERVRRREERRFGMQEQASGYLSPITERKDPLSVEENIDLNMPDDLGESLCPSPVSLFLYLYGTSLILF